MNKKDEANLREAFNIHYIFIVVCLIVAGVALNNSAFHFLEPTGHWSNPCEAGLLNYTSTTLMYAANMGVGCPDGIWVKGACQEINTNLMVECYACTQRTCSSDVKLWVKK